MEISFLKITSNIIPKGKLLMNSLFLRSETNQGCSLLPLLFNMYGPSQCSRIWKGSRTYKTEREEIKLSLFSDDMITYR